MSEPQPHDAQPGQPYAQPGQPYAQPGQPYGSPHPPYPYGAGTSSAAPAGNALGRTAFFVTVVAVGVGLVARMLLQLLVGSVGFGIAGTVQGVLSFLVFVGAATGFVLAIAALRRPAPHLLAAIAIGVAGSTVLSTVVSFAANMFYGFGF